MKISDIQICTDNADNFIRNVADVIFTLTEGNKKKECSFKIPMPGYNFPMETALQAFGQYFNQEIRKFQEEIDNDNTPES
ncbi:hypothetical protein [Pedobacter sp.]|uniref:hypothetical protein n=1 Tax=Pedobacter sp. TaxID=1411316 RepID=UPI003C6044BA